MAEILDEHGLRNRYHVFEDRYHAGEMLSEKLEEYADRSDVCVLAIPAGGVQVGVVIAERLRAPLDVVVTRKLHVPWNREVGFGAISWDGLMFLNEPIVAALGLTREEIDRCVEEEKEAIEKRLRKFRDDMPFPDLDGKTAIVVDDGLASRFSMLTTLRALRQKGVGEAVVAVPTAPESAIRLIRFHADRIFCLNIRSGAIFAVADAYKLWYDLSDEEVVDILEKSEYNSKWTVARAREIVK